MGAVLRRRQFDSAMSMSNRLRNVYAKGPRLWLQQCARSGEGTTPADILGGKA